MPDQPGWYPDPARPETARWWDGRRWTSAVREATPPPVPAAAAGGVPGWAPPPPPPQGFRAGPLTGNVLSLLSAVVAVAYVAAFFQHVVFFLGLLPVGLAAAGYRLHERLAVPALVLAGLVFVGNLVAIAAR